MRNKVKYFVTKCNNSCMSVFVSRKGLEYDYNIGQNYFTKSAIPPVTYFLIINWAEFTG